MTAAETPLGMCLNTRGHPRWAAGGGGMKGIQTVGETARWVLVLVRISLPGFCGVSRPPVVL